MLKDKFNIILPVALVILVFIIPVIACYEAYTLKEVIVSRSAGDCRIVNTAESIKSNSELRIYKMVKNGKTYEHLIAVDKNRIIADFSKIEEGATSLNGKPLEFFEEHNDIIPILMYSKVGFSKDADYGTILQVYGYIKPFIFFYKILHT